MIGHDLRTAMNDLLSRWRDYRRGQCALKELDTDPELAASIANEFRLSVPELKQVVAKGAGADQLMRRMMAAFNLDPRTVRNEMPMVLRDVEILCSRCDQKGRCARELDARTAAENAHEFCPNAPSLEAIVKSRASA